jgi:hypothetical protein
MNGMTTHHSFGRFAHKAKMLAGFIATSFLLAVILNNSKLFWSFLSWLPRSVVEAAISALNGVLFAFKPIEIHAQEEQLEFFVAWLISGIVLLVSYMLFITIKVVINARAKNAP